MLYLRVTLCASLLIVLAVNDAVANDDAATVKSGFEKCLAPGPLRIVIGEKRQETTVGIDLTCDWKSNQEVFEALKRISTDQKDRYWADITWSLRIDDGKPLALTKASRHCTASRIHGPFSLGMRVAVDMGKERFRKLRTLHELCLARQAVNAKRRSEAIVPTIIRHMEV